jgi:hypothetical protein
VASKPGEVLCFVCNKVIPAERVEFLRGLRIPEHEMTTVDCSTTKKKKALYMGEHGTSELKIVDKVYNDSVRDVFRRSTQEAMEDMEEDNREYDPDPSIKDIVGRDRGEEKDE